MGVMTKRTSSFPSLATLAIAPVYMIAVLGAERQTAILGLFVLAIAVILAAGLLGLLRPVAQSFADHERAFALSALAALITIAGIFREDHFVLLLLVTVMLYVVATLGLNIQFGYAGMVNFAGASFFGIGAYASAVLN